MVKMVGGECDEVEKRKIEGDLRRKRRGKERVMEVWKKE